MGLVSTNPTSGAEVPGGGIIEIGYSSLPDGFLTTVTLRRENFPDETIYAGSAFQAGYTGSRVTGGTGEVLKFKRDDGWGDSSEFQIVLDDGTTESTINYVVAGAGDALAFMGVLGPRARRIYLNTLRDVDVPLPGDSEVLGYDAAQGKWTPRAPSTPGSHTLGSHADVNTAGAQDQEALVYDAGSGTWVPGEAVGGGGTGYSPGLGLWRYNGTATDGNALAQGNFATNAASGWTTMFIHKDNLTLLPQGTGLNALDGNSIHVSNEDGSVAFTTLVTSSTLSGSHYIVVGTVTASQGSLLNDENYSVVVAPAAASAGGGAETLSDLTDTNIGGSATGDVLVWDGTDWVNSEGPNYVKIWGTASYTGPSIISAGVLRVTTDFPSKLEFLDDNSGALDISGNLPTADQKAALDAADSGGAGPSGANPFITLDEVGALGGGTVTSVSITGTDGIEVDSGSPITGAGAIVLGSSKLLGIEAGAVAAGAVGDAYAVSHEADPTAHDASEITGLGTASTRTVGNQDIHNLPELTAEGTLPITDGVNTTTYYSDGINSTGAANSIIVTDGSYRSRAYVDSIEAERLSNNAKAGIYSTASGPSVYIDDATYNTEYTPTGITTTSPTFTVAGLDIKALDTDLQTLPSPAQKLALDGATTPGDTNVFLTENDFGTIVSINSRLTDGPVSAFKTYADDTALQAAQGIANQYGWRDSDNTLWRDSGSAWEQVGGGGTGTTPDDDTLEISGTTGNLQVKGGRLPAVGAILDRPADPTATETGPLIWITDNTAPVVERRLSIYAGGAWDYLNVDFPNVRMSTANRLLGSTGTPGAAEELSGAQVTAQLSAFDGVTKGVVPSTSGDDSTVSLLGDGTWGAPNVPIAKLTQGSLAELESALQTDIDVILSDKPGDFIRLTDGEKAVEILDTDHLVVETPTASGSKQYIAGSNVVGVDMYDGGTQVLHDTTKGLFRGINFINATDVAPNGTDSRVVDVTLPTGGTGSGITTGTGDPTGGSDGDFYYDTVAQALWYNDSATWEEVGISITGQTEKTISG